MTYVEIHGILVPRIAIGLAIVVVYLIGAFAMRNLLLRYLGRLAKKSGAQWDAALVASLLTPSTLIILASAGWVCLRYMQLPQDWNQLIDQSARVGLILALILFIDRLLREVIELHREGLQHINLAGGFAKALVRIAILIVASLIILDTLHISITPLLASLGVGGLAVGLALQGTLSNLFAGIQIISTRPIRLGDFIRLQSGEEGYVSEIGWRATQLRMLSNTIVIVPNSKLAETIITNYYLPEKEIAVFVQAGVSYQNDLTQVERVTLEVARDIQETVAGAIRGFRPLLRFHTLDSSSISFTVIMRVAEFADQHLVKHEFIKRLHAGYDREGIALPSPSTTLELSEEVLKQLSAISNSPRPS